MISSVDSVPPFRQIYEYRLSSFYTILLIDRPTKADENNLLHGDNDRNFGTIHAQQYCLL